MNAPANDNAAPVTTPPAGNPKRRTALTAIAVAVLVIGGGYGIYYWMTGRHSESTDNAYVQANVVQITAQAGGTVTAINADDTDFVKAGQLLVKLDPADARVALDQAEAALASTVRETRILFANNSTLQAQIDARAADATRAKADLDKAQDDVTRRQPLVQSGAVGKEEFSHATDTLASAKSAYTAAKSALDAAREQLSSNQTQTEGTSVAEHPNVQRAAAKVREAWLAVQRADVPAPVSGTVARRSVQVGQRVQAGVPLMSVVTLDNAWVDANFKEGQLERLRIGQPATLEADVYGKHVVFHGKVEGLGAGTGAAFSLLPAQNATGNWIKVVQRVPVRISLDPKEIAQNPLRVGLSMNVSVNVADESGRSVSDTPRTQAQGAIASTTVFDSLQHDADAEVARIVAANGGGRIKVQDAPVAASAPTAAASSVKVASATRHHHHKQS
ncbi:HlyD family efflux transporter periplasmic adaptor subunit [Scleromatobacter humisilvae]|uniref:HlyD family efflux transporter periplasmic adaptor subunit n=1 Tax=Scleromatobacter humisilvae TaxID=2897159 RepID=A0A9X1YP72_9BURK|nr:efflux RND transporter periplasmic adaptor subunit [Scleromatobacter humisilvae]MCK9688600.1 HlyD family efflux transporter periplasmic adaptor subunit [Scleromatobacter humisilvae]